MIEHLTGVVGMGVGVDETIWQAKENANRETEFLDMPKGNDIKQKG